MLERRVPKKRGKGAYYYEWYLFCGGCKRMFLVEEARSGVRVNHIYSFVNFIFCLRLQG